LQQKKETAMTQDTQIVLPFARLSGKILQADFDGGTLSSDGGVLFFREIEAQIGIIRRLAGALDDPRDARYTDPSYEEMLSQRIFQIACGYEDANDGNTLRHDPAFKAACGRLPCSDDSLASQPGMSRFENAPRRSELYRMAQAVFDTFAASYEQAPKCLLLDIDDTADEVHGAQQQSLFNGYYDSYCYLPLHIYEGQSGQLITTILRQGRRPTGKEIVSILKRVVGAVRREWPEVIILLRGDGHFSTPEVHEWCESQEPAIYYILSQGGNKVLKENTSGILQQAQLLYRLSIRKYLSGDGFLTTVNKYLIFRELKDRFESKSRSSGSGIPLGMSSLSVSPQIAHHGTEGATIPRPIAIAQGAKQVRQSIGRGHGSLAG
jgi:hypothetical protein